LPIDEPPPEDNEPIPAAEIIGPDAQAHEIVKKTFRKHKMSAKFVKDQLVSCGLNKVEDIPLKDAVSITNQIVKNWEKKKK
jgi:hypothetical protein